MSSDLAQEIGERLREEVNRLGGPSTVSKILGVHRNTINNWFTSGAADAMDLHFMALLGVDVLYVVRGTRQQEGLFPKSGGGEQIRVYVGEREFQVSPDDYRWIPVLNIQVAGGMGQAVTAENVVAFNAWRKDWLAKRGLLEAALSEVTVSGDSMAPELRHGDVVLVNHSDREVQGGSIYVLRQSEDLLVKYLQKLPGGRVQVNSESSAFPSYVIEADAFDSGECEIVGRVIRQGRER